MSKRCIVICKNLQMADIKTLLKEARKLIDENKFKDAQECCKNILRKDKNNYLGLVLLGKALQDSDQAPLAYQKAIASKSDHPLAWQGLANYYERKEDSTEKIKLFSIYDGILQLQIDEEKTIEIITKLGQLGCSLKNNDCISSFIKYHKKASDEKLCKSVEIQLLQVLKSDITCKEEDIQATLEILSKIYATDPTDSLELLQAKVILQKSNFTSAIEELMNLSFFPRNVVLREWLCKYLCKKYVENNSFCNLNIEKHIHDITKGIENSKYPALLRSMICYDKHLYLDAYKQCVPLINYHQADVTEATFITKCTIALKKWSVTQKLTTNFLNNAKDQSLINELWKFQFICLAKQKKWQQAIEVSKHINMTSLSDSEKAILGECFIENGESADIIFNELQHSDHYNKLQALLLMKKGENEKAVSVLDNCIEDYLNLFYLSKAHWELKQFDQCLRNLLQAAKLNPDHSETFLYLGHFYRHHKQDLEKAKKCYEKAYSLNATDSDIVKNLSEVYSKLSLKDADFEILSTAEKSIQTNEFWIHFRLGLHYLNRREWESAIVKFRNVIKYNPNDVTAFECLADAYYSRGSFTSALKAYNKVITMNPRQTSHCLTRIGYIYSVLTQYENAVATFEKVFSIEPYSLLALKGIAETWMRIARKKNTAKLYGAARDCAQHAINYIMKGLTRYKQFSCMWKLLGDSLMFITRLPTMYSYVHLNNQLTDPKEDTTQRNEKLDIFPQAIACYSQIAIVKQQPVSFDLASAYLAYYCETKKIENCRISYNLIVRCIKSNPINWRNWNLLGKICLFIQKYDIAQHCFIKALLLTRKWSVAKIWCNLGTLYLKLKLYKLANYCFWRGQSTLPSYPHSWIGQGLIAEVIREEEAMDLFRHASRLGYHPESALGYADWVCRTLNNDNYKSNPEFKYVIDGLHAIPYAIDLVEWYTTYEPNDACAFTILGILQERNGLILAAFKSYEKAFKYAVDDKKNITLLNVGRIMLRMERYDEAIKIYKAITEASLNSTCGLALALFKKGLYEESYAAYDTALHWLSNDDGEKADLLVAMAGIVYMFKGVDDAKTLLFHSIQISQKPSAYCLFAICSLGLMHSDQSLSKLAVSELKKYERESDYGFDIGFLKSYSFYREENIEQAIKLLSESLHDHPSDAKLWFYLAQYSLKASITKANIASSCAKKAIYLAHDDSNYNSARILATATIAEHISGNQFKALSLAKQGLHIYPNQAEVWAALLFSLVSDKKWVNRKDWLLAATGHMRRHLDISRNLSRWASFLEKKL